MDKNDLRLELLKIRIEAQNSLTSTILKIATLLIIVMGFITKEAFDPPITKQSMLILSITTLVLSGSCLLGNFFANKFEKRLLSDICKLLESIETELPLPSFKTSILHEGLILATIIESTLFAGSLFWLWLILSAPK